MSTEKLLCPAGELYLDYGKGFWEIQRDRFMEIEVWQRDLDRALQVCAAGAVLLELYCWSCIVVCIGVHPKRICFDISMTHHGLRNISHFLT